MLVIADSAEINYDGGYLVRQDSWDRSRGSGEKRKEKDREKEYPGVIPVSASSEGYVCVTSRNVETRGTNGGGLHLRPFRRKKENSPSSGHHVIPVAYQREWKWRRRDEEGEPSVPCL